MKMWNSHREVSPLIYFHRFAGIGMIYEFKYESDHLFLVFIFSILASMLLLMLHTRLLCVLSASFQILRLISSMLPDLDNTLMYFYILSVIHSHTCTYSMSWASYVGFLRSHDLK